MLTSMQELEKFNYIWKVVLYFVWDSTPIKSKQELNYNAKWVLLATL